MKTLPDQGAHRSRVCRAQVCKAKKVDRAKTYRTKVYRDWGAIFTLALFAVIAGCGPKKDLGEFLAISVKPGKVFIVPGTGFSCSDKVSAKASGQIATPSISEHRIFFSNFRLAWNSSDTLYVSRIKITISGSAIEGDEYSVTLSTEELEALLAAPQGKIVGKQEINSSDAARDNGPYVPCGLHIGGIKFIEDAPSTFTTRVDVQVDGYSENADGEQSRVQQKLKADAEFF